MDGEPWYYKDDEYRHNTDKKRHILWRRYIKDFEIDEVT